MLWKKKKADSWAVWSMMMMKLVDVHMKVSCLDVTNWSLVRSDRVGVFFSSFTGEQSGAAGACWAHNPEVDGSKPSSAKFFFQNFIAPILFSVFFTSFSPFLFHESFFTQRKTSFFFASNGLEIFCFFTKAYRNFFHPQTSEHPHPKMAICRGCMPVGIFRDDSSIPSPGYRSRWM